MSVLGLQMPGGWEWLALLVVVAVVLLVLLRVSRGKVDGRDGK